MGNSIILTFDEYQQPLLPPPPPNSGAGERTVSSSGQKTDRCGCHCEATTTSVLSSPTDFSAANFVERCRYF